MNGAQEGASRTETDRADRSLTIAIVTTPYAYLPEAHAYASYLQRCGHDAQAVPTAGDASPADIAIVFSWRDQWNLRHARARVVHEYHSLSGGSAAASKDRLKRLLAPPPAGRIFIDTAMRLRFGFAEEVPTLYRPMGIDAALFGCAVSTTMPDYDLLYCGTLHRAGVMPTLEELAKRGFRVLAVGAVPSGATKIPGVELTGPLARPDLPQAFQRARFGLNFTPDVHPFNVQISTKTLEYAAAGLGVVANRYPWIERFARETGTSVTWLDTLTTPDSLPTETILQPSLAHLEWARILDAAKFEPFIAGLGGSR